jgi:alkylhydroperoxidase/carboxymuconolactone decarboxylase family protein YurZ
MASPTPTPTSSREDPKSTVEAILGPGTFNNSWSQISRFSPEILHASLALHSVPLKKQHLSPKIQSLVALSVDCAATHLYTPGIRSKILSSLAAGASIAEITEVIELTSTLGIHACNIGVPILVDVMKEVGGFEGHVALRGGGENAGLDGGLDERRKRLKEEFTRNRGYWHEFWEDFLRLDPEFFEAYARFSSVPWLKEVDGKKGGVLEPKVCSSIILPHPVSAFLLPRYSISQGYRDGIVLNINNTGFTQIKELVYCAFDAAATHLYVPGLRLHMKNALGYGATPEEIMEVLEIATLLSLHTAETAFPILGEMVDGTEDAKT